MKRNRKLLLLLVSAAFFSSCLKDTLDELSGIKGVKTANEFSMPLVSMTMGMKELYESALQSAYIQPDPNNLLVFTYRGGDTVPTQQFVAIPSVDFSYPIRFPNALAIQAFNFNNRLDVTIDTSISLPTSGGNEQIKLIKVKKGKFTISVTNSFRHDATVAISYPGIKKNGVAYSDNITLNYDPNDYPKTVTHTLDLADYDVDFSKNGTTANEIGFSYTIALVRIPANATSLTDSLSIGQTFAIESYKQVTGYLGKFEIIHSHMDQEIDLFSKNISGKILVNDPRLVLRIFNSYGVPVTGRIYNLKIITVDSQNFPVVIDQFRDTFSFQRPLVPGDVAVSEYKIDKNNSNLDDAINSGPARVEFDLEFSANYNDIVQDNFLVDGSMFRTEVDFELPMDIKILDYEVLERSSFKLGNIPSKGVESANLYVRTENGLPFDVFMQMLFVKDTIIGGQLDSNYVIDSLFNHELAITGGTVDANGKVVAPFVSLNTVGLPIKRLSKIHDEAKNTLTRVRIQTSQFGGSPGFVKIYTDQKLNMKLGGNIKFILKSNDL
jgi:hypothetical protein